MLIANPTAGRHAPRKVQRAVEILSKSSWRVQLQWTSGPGHATELARAAVESGAAMIVAAGGDGTLNEVVNGMAPSSIPLGLIPLGTANCFALETRVPLEPERAARLLLQSQPRWVHLGHAAERYFVLMASIGLDADVVYRLDIGMKKRFGKLAYVATGLRCALDHDPPLLHLILDGKEQLSGYGVVVSNMRYYGGRFQVTPHAGFDKEELDLCLFLKKGLPNLLRYTWGILRGSHLKYPDVLYRKAKEIQVDSERPCPVQADGDFLGMTPLRIRVVPNALRVMLPPPEDS